MHEPDPQLVTPPPQFSLRSLFTLTTPVAVFLGVTICLQQAGVVLFLIGLTIWFGIRYSVWLPSLAMVVMLLFILNNVVVLMHRDTTPRSRCLQNLLQIGMGLHNYEQYYHCLPPPYLADAHGKPMHSWRVLLLPFIGGEDLYQQYRFDEPWDGPHNRQLHNVVVDLYRCPSAPKYAKSTDTSYLAVTGPETAWQGTKGIRFDEIKDGLAETILLVEVADAGIHWMEPRDLPLASMQLPINSSPRNAISSNHKPSAWWQQTPGPGRANVAAANRVVYSLPDTTPTATLRALLTIAGGEKATFEELESQ